MSKPIRILLHGATGRMGRAVAAVATRTAGVEVTGAIELREDRHPPHEVAGTVLRKLGTASQVGDVVIDFSHASGVGPLFSALKGSHLAVVCGTTGIGAKERELLDVYSKESPVFYDENMSYGISVVKGLLRSASVALTPVADVEIVEFHHRGKADFPSGTAAALARVVRPDGAVVAGRDKEPGPGDDRVHIHSLRAGGNPGEHAVHFATDDEVVTVSHRALSRDVFAAGALRGARFITARDKGLFCMSDLVERAEHG